MTSGLIQEYYWRTKRPRATTTVRLIWVDLDALCVGKRMFQSTCFGKKQSCSVDHIHCVVYCKYALVSRLGSDQKVKFYIGVTMTGPLSSSIRSGALHCICPSA